MRKAFTLIETLLVMATLSIVFVISVPLYQSFQVRNDLNVVVDVFIQSLARAQARAAYMEKDSDWGVRIETTSNKIQNITIFKGSAFPGASDDFNEVFFAPSSIQTTVEDPEFVFKKFTGELSVASGSVTFTAPQIGAIQRVVTINKKGTVTITAPQLPPDVITGAASPVGTTTATLNGIVGPNGDASTGWFRYRNTSSSSCVDDNSWGTRVPSSGGTALGNGSSYVGYSENITGLTGSTTYYVCAFASNSAGAAMGSPLSFFTPIAPTVATVTPTSVTGSSVTLQGSLNPNGATATGWFRYSTTNPGTCDDTFGTRAPTSGGDNLGSGTSAVAYEEPATGLSPNTTHYFCAIASNSIGTSFSSPLSFNTSAVAPTTVTSAATSIAVTSATLNGTGNPNNASTIGWFRYCKIGDSGCVTVPPSTCNDTFGTRAPASSGDNLGFGGSAVAYSEVISGLTESTTYYFCAIASNSVGTSVGTVLSFATSSAIGSWTAQTSGTTQAINAIAYSPTLSRFVIGMQNGTTRYSTNGGVTWTAGGTVPVGSGGSAPHVQNLLWSSTFNIFVAVGIYTVGAVDLPAVWTSTNSVTWALVNSSGGSTGVAEASNMVLAVNGSGTSVWSDDGSSWNAGTTGTNDNQRGVAFGAGVFVAVGDAGVIFSSPAGTSWTARSSGTSTNIYSIAYSSQLGVFLAERSDGGSRTSTNGITWTAGSTGVNPNSTDKTRWIGSMFLSATATAGRFDRRDTPTSTVIAMNTGDSDSPSDIATDGSVLVAVHTSGHIRTAPLSQFAPTVTTVAASSIGGTSATLNGTATPNGASATGWFRYDTTDPGTCNDNFGTRVPSSSGSALGFGNSPVSFDEPITGLNSSAIYYFCAIASNSLGTSFGSVLSFTINPLIGSWTERTSGTTAAIYAIAYSPTLNRFVIGQDGGFVRYSNDSGVTWTSAGTLSPASGATSTTVFDVMWSTDYSKFVVVGKDTDAAGNIRALSWTSSDGITWSAPVILVVSAQGRSIAELNGTFIVTGLATNVARSTNGGSSWSLIATGSANNLQGVVAGQNQFIAVGTAGEIRTSGTGSTWTARTSGTTGQFNNVEYSPSLDVFLGTATPGGIARTSTDGITWTEGSWGSSTPATKKTRWIGSTFLSATSAAGRFDRRDTPASTVIAVDTGDTSAPFDVATDGNVLVAVHVNGHIRTAPLNPSGLLAWWKLDETAGTDGSNLVTNPGIETNTTGYFAAQSVLSRDVTTSRSGTASLKAIPNGGSTSEGGQWTSISGLSAGKSYYAEGWSRTNGAGTGQNTRFTVYNETDVVALQFIPGTFESTVFTKQSATFTAVAGKAYRLLLYKSSTTGNVTPIYWDDITVQEIQAKDSADSYHGTLKTDNTAGPTIGTAGKVGTAYSFDGVDDYISHTATNSFTPTDPVSLEAWFKLAADAVDEPSSQPIINSKYFRLHVRTGSNIIYARTDDAVSDRYATYTLGAGDRNWHHVVATYEHTGSNEIIKIYVDGVLRNTRTHAATPSSVYNLFMGLNSFATAPFNGSLDEVRIYNSVLTAEQVTARYNLTN